jgi:hypothetical protein
MTFTTQFLGLDSLPCQFSDKSNSVNLHPFAYCAAWIKAIDPTYGMTFSTNLEGFTYKRLKLFSEH